jgi:predicted nucleic-acid-binding protein
VIGVDTNILIRYLTQDDPISSPRANGLIEETLTAANPGFVNLIVLVETAWVLRRAYRYSCEDVADEVERLLQIESLILDHEDEVFATIVALRRGLGEFADALIAALNSGVGCTHTLTFDRRAARLPGIELA